MEWFFITWFMIGLVSAFIIVKLDRGVVMSSDLIKISFMSALGYLGFVLLLIFSFMLSVEKLYVYMKDHDVALW